MDEEHERREVVMVVVGRLRWEEVVVVVWLVGW